MKTQKITPPIYYEKENYKKLKEYYGESKAKNLMYKWRKGLHKAEKQRELLTVCGYDIMSQEIWFKENHKVFIQ